MKLPFTVPHPSHPTGEINNLVKAPESRHSFRILPKFSLEYYYPQIKVGTEIKVQLLAQDQT